MSLIEYHDAIAQIETDIYHTASDSGKIKDFQLIQQRLDDIAVLYKEDDSIGKARYKLYELQALLHYYMGNDELALTFINDAADSHGEDYPKADEIRELILASGEKKGSGNINNQQGESGIKQKSVAQNLLSDTISIIVKLFIIIAILFIAGIIMGLTKSLTNGATQTDYTQSSNYLTTDTSNRAYTSTKYGFTAKFPGNPTVSNSTKNVQGVSIPYTSYERVNGDKYFTVEVAEYPSDMDMSDVDARLEAVINGSAQAFKNSILIDSWFGQLAGYRSITGKITATIDNNTYTAYETAFLKGNNLFMVLTVGIDQAAFDSFANTLRLN